MVKPQCYSKLPIRTRNDQKVKIAFFNSPEYKMHKIKRFFFLGGGGGVNTKRAVKISADTLVLRTHDNFSPHLTNIFIIHHKQ